MLQKKSFTKKSFDNNFINKVIEAQVQKLFDQHLKSINNTLTTALFNTSTTAANDSSIMSYAFNYSTSQVSSYLIRGILQKL
ncbi:MAG: hypothetical protein MRQ09_04670 [Candidatus Midichloria sp.]|nr:hypothetical protein [Candidatus Midichloria sp.]